MFAFGHGLSYTSFALTNLTARRDGRAVRVTFSIRNTGKREGKGVGEVYVMPANWKAARWEGPRRLGAFAKADLKPEQSRTIELTVDPRLLATYEAAGDKWHIHAGDYRVALGESSDSVTQSVDLALPDQAWSASTVPE